MCQIGWHAIGTRRSLEVLMGRSHDPDKIGWLYFVASEEQDAVKIGFTDDLYMRLKSIQTGNPAELTLLAKVRGTLGAEKALHALLRPYRIRLEWFRSLALAEYIADELRDQILDRVLPALPMLPEGSGLQEAADALEAALGQHHITAADVRRVIPAVIAEFRESEDA
jgi:hypothetical protein